MRQSYDLQKLLVKLQDCKLFFVWIAIINKILFKKFDSDVFERLAKLLNAKKVVYTKKNVKNDKILKRQRKTAVFSL